MLKALRQRVRVQPGGRIELTAPGVPEGTEADVVVLLPASAGDGADAPSLPPGPARTALDADGLPILPPLDESKPLSLADLVGIAPSGRTAEEIDRELRALRDEWDRDERD